MFPTFATFRNSDIAQAALYRVWLVMSRAYEKHGESWRDKSPEWHVSKGLVHLCTSHHFGIGRKEDGVGANTGMLELDHALTRLCMASMLLNPHCEPIADVEVVVDTVEEEIKE